jgi:hypothetical protein
MHKYGFCLALLFICKFSTAQKIETVYLDSQDSTSNLYTIVYPSTLPWKGYAILIPGMFQKAKDVLTQSDLPGYAAQQGILTIIPTFKTGISSLGIDTATQASFLELLTHLTNNYKLAGLSFYVGGFSIGGTCALKYSELALRNNYPVKPAAVFAIDSPLDFERMFNTIVREKRILPNGQQPQEEGEYLIKRFKKVFVGTPAEALPNYFNLSPYSFNDTTQYAIKPLIDLPIRLYTEPDVLWWLDDGSDYSGMNAFDFAAMTNELKRLGNKNITLITTDKKGYRKPGNTRHPHSWSIAEPKDLVKWLLTHK